MAEVKKTSPLISFGTFGLHTNLCPTGRWAFVGTIPIQLKGMVKDTEAELILEVYKWLHSVCPGDFAECVPLLRADILAGYEAYLLAIVNKYEEAL